MSVAASSRPPMAAVYSGSFDPFHLGHEDVARRAARVFDQVVVALGENPEKHPLFSPAERVEMISTILKDEPNIEVRAYSGLTVDFARGLGAKVLVRGIRALADVEYEFTMSLTNKSLDEELETFFLMSGKEYSHLSSSLIRQIAKCGGRLDGFVPALVESRLRERFGVV